MLWIAVTLPDLPLEAVRPRSPSPSEAQVVAAVATTVITAAATHHPASRTQARTQAGSAVALVRQQRVLQVDAQAAAAGIRSGMSRAQAQALLPGLCLLSPDPARVEAALRGVALALLRYTPRVVLAQEHTILLEVTASLRLFGGLRALWRALAATVGTSGYRAALACAPTPWGSWLLARQRAAQAAWYQVDATATATATAYTGRYRVVRLPMLVRQLDRLPLMRLPAAAEHGHALEQMGCTTLAALRALPSAGVARRFGAGVLQQLAQAYGTAPDPRTAFEAPARFDARLDLQARVSHTEALLSAAQHLLAQLAGWLTARHAALRGYTLILIHEKARGGATESSSLPLAWAVPSRDPAQWAWLLRETLARTPLRAAVIELQLQADAIESYTPVAASLFTLPGQDGAQQTGGIVQLTERLSARLGREQVCALALQADHRPEAAAGQVEPTLARAGSGRTSGRAAPGTSSKARTSSQRRRTVPSADLIGAAQALRPFWLLDTPQALAADAIRTAGALRPTRGWRLLQGPERIESGWWDGAGATRDYFVARAAQGGLGWIYRDCGNGQWFLHGWFA